MCLSLLLLAKQGFIHFVQPVHFLPEHCSDVVFCVAITLQCCIQHGTVPGLLTCVPHMLLTCAVTTVSAAAMARQRQEVQQHAFEGMSLEAVLKTAKKPKPAPFMSKRRSPLLNADAVTADLDHDVHV